MIIFYKKMFSDDMERAVDVVYLDFNKAFDTVSLSLLPGKLARYRLGRQPAKWVGNWLTGHSQRVTTVFT